MSRWKAFKLKKLTTKIGSGATPKGGQEAYHDSGISLIRSQNVLDFEFSDNRLAFIDEDQAQKLSNVVVEDNDVLVNITGDSVARVCKVPYDILPARVNQHVSIVRPDTQKVDSDFLLYFLLNPVFKKHLLRLASDGGTRNALTKSDLEGLEILVPPINEQEDIAEILSCLDRKIENLRRQNETLEAIAQTLFKHWFVDFEFPNADGKPYKSSGGEMVPSELGEIPAGWHVGTLEEIVDVFTGFPFKSDLYSFDSGIRVVRGENVSLGFLRWDTEKRWEHDLDSYLDYFLQRNDYVIGMDGSRVGKNRTIILNSDLPLILAQRVARLRAKNPGFSGYVNVFLKQNRFERYVDFIKTGTSIPHISATQIKEFECLIPTGDVVEAFQKFYKPWSEN
ncbi:MAG: restriction endonuclease subunit S [Leptolyngbya sp. SIO4C5]|nr:restriction endonuclease subunit S [Leptolyngbya sp. SIO4C5]